jgi:hypothetical protein
MAFETNEALTRTITVANLRGPLNKVVEKVCGLADLYCSYEGGILVIKETRPLQLRCLLSAAVKRISSTSLATGVQAITGSLRPPNPARAPLFTKRPTARPTRRALLPENPFQYGADRI